MLVARQFPFHCQFLAPHSFGLGQLGLPLEHLRQGGKRDFNPSMDIAEQFLAHRQCLAIHPFGLGQLAFF